MVVAFRCLTRSADALGSTDTTRRVSSQKTGRPGRGPTARGIAA
jgi:hypothetical protein